jgi:hypothetical protein
MWRENSFELSAIGCQQYLSPFNLSPLTSDRSLVLPFRYAANLLSPKPDPARAGLNPKGSTKPVRRGGNQITKDKPAEYQMQIRRLKFEIRRQMQP